MKEPLLGSMEFIVTADSDVHAEKVVLHLYPSYRYIHSELLSVRGFIDGSKYQFSNKYQLICKLGPTILNKSLDLNQNYAFNNGTDNKNGIVISKDNFRCIWSLGTGWGNVIFDKKSVFALFAFSASSLALLIISSIKINSVLCSNREYPSFKYMSN